MSSLLSGGTRLLEVASLFEDPSLDDSRLGLRILEVGEDQFSSACCSDIIPRIS